MKNMTMLDFCLFLKDCEKTLELGMRKAVQCCNQSSEGLPSRSLEDGSAESKAD